jgi:hypothetical protein
MEIKDIYTPIEEAGDIIRKRWADKDLRSKVEEKLKGNIPEILKDGSHGLIWRQICTPDREFNRFLELNKIAGLKPICFEYIQDKFAARNFTKYALTNLPLSNGLDKEGKTIIVREKIIDFTGAEKKRMCDIETLWGENLVGFHHFFLKEMFSITEDQIFDVSEWIKTQGSTPLEHYVSFFTLATCYFVIFDDFDLLGTENNFVKEVVLPAYDMVQKNFDFKPIIVKISRVGEHQKDPFWWCYSKEAKEVLYNHIKTYK